MTRRGCLDRTVFTVLFMAALGLSTYFWFTFFVRGRSIAAPTLIGRAVSDARAMSSDRGLILVIDSKQDRPSNNVAKGAVVWQNRAPGNLLKRGSRIYVGQSLGPLVLQVPDLSGQSARTALLRFSQRNLKLGNLSYIDLPGGRGITAEDPPRGTVVQGQTAVSLLVASPPAPPRYVMPDLIDRPLSDVRPLLEARGLIMTNVRYESYPGIAEGIIIRQFPPHGSPVMEKDAISVVVSQNEQFTQPASGAGVLPAAPAPAAPELQ